MKKKMEEGTQLVGFTWFVQLALPSTPRLTATEEYNKCKDTACQELMFC
jgi:hypothetical protein